MEKKRKKRNEEKKIGRTLAPPLFPLQFSLPLHPLAPQWHSIAGSSGSGSNW